MKWLLSALLTIALIAPQLATACAWTIPSGGLDATVASGGSVSAAVPGLTYVCRVDQATELTTNLAVTDCGSNSKLYNPDDDNASTTYKISETRLTLTVASIASTTISTPFDYAKVYGGVFNATTTGRVTVTPNAGELTSSGTTATLAHTAHGFAAKDVVLISGASQAAYNGTFAVATVANANTLTYTTDSEPSASPATGSIVFTELFNIVYYCATD